MHARPGIGLAGRRGLALSELLLVVVSLTLLLSIIVSLSRRVRRESAHDLAERVLVELDAALAAYHAQTGQLPDVTPLLPEDGEANVTEAVLATRGLVNNRQVVEALQVAGRADRSADRPEDATEAGEPDVVLDTLGLILFDGSTLRDPWGTPIVYMAHGSRLVGTAAANRPFFFSAGPDGQYLTRDDNIYSYEATRPTPAEPEPLPPEPPESPTSPAPTDSGDWVDSP